MDSLNVPLNQRITVTLQDAVKLTGIGRRRLEELAKVDINFPSFKIGRKTMIHVEQLNKYLEQKAKARVGEATMSPRVAKIYARKEVK